MTASTCSKAKTVGLPPCVGRTAKAFFIAFVFSRKTQEAAASGLLELSRLNGRIWSERGRREPSRPTPTEPCICGGVSTHSGRQAQTAPTKGGVTPEEAPSRVRRARSRDRGSGGFDGVGQARGQRRTLHSPDRRWSGRRSLRRLISETRVREGPPLPNATSRQSAGCRLSRGGAGQTDLLTQRCLAYRASRARVHT